MAACLAALSLAGASPAAATTIGQLAPASPAASICGFQDLDIVQTVVTAGNTYAVPPYGATIVSWSTNASTEVGQLYTLKVFRKISAPATYMVVAHDGPRPLAAGALNTFPVDIAVKPGDIIGLNFHQGMASSACEFIAMPADDYFERSGSLGDGSSDVFVSHGGGYRVNVSAVVKPSSAFTLGEAKRNKKKGTATLTVDVPGPGELALSGKGVKTAGAVTAKTVPTAGEVELLIKAKGKKKRKLNETGKVKVSFGVTYTPTGGDPSAQSRKLKLKKR